MLILAGISLSGLIGEKGLFKRTEDASSRYNEKKAREVLETVLLTDGQFEKNTNSKYNQDDFLDDLIKKEIPGSKVIEDVAIVDGYGYELDRSVPKIGRYVGKEDDLIWPTVDVTVKLADDKKDATITITASEEKQGINKIEIWLLGEKIKEYKYDPSKPEATENYTATQNGEYTIKAYGDLMASKTVEVTGIVPEIEFDPNGSEEWKKEHSTKIIVKKTAEKIKNMKYVWTNSVTEPADNTFTENCKDGDTITKNGVTGKYYLWAWLETENGAIAKRRSEAFNFDNQGPTVELTSAPKTGTSFSLSVTARDIHSGLKNCKFYVGGTLKNTVDISSGKADINVSVSSMGNYNCSVIVTDKLENSTTKSITARTSVYRWKVYSLVSTTTWEMVTSDLSKTVTWFSHTDPGYSFDGYSSITQNENTGCITGVGTPSRVNARTSQYGVQGSACSKYEIKGGRACRYVCATNRNGNLSAGYVDWLIKEYRGESKKTYSKGEFTGRYVTSTNLNAYPNSSYSGSYWYVYDGLA